MLNIKKTLEKFFGSSTSIGLSLNHQKLRIAKLATENGTLVLSTDIFSFYENDVKRLDIADIIPSNAFISGALPAKKVLIRGLKIGLLKEKDVFKVLPFEAEPLLPFPSEEAVIEGMITAQDGTGTTLTLFATQKEDVKEALGKIQALGIDPDVISTDAYALSVLSKMFPSKNPELPSLILHIGSKESLCLIETEGTPLALHSFSEGKESLEEALKIDDSFSSIEKIDFASLDKEKYPELFKKLSSLKNEAIRAVFSLLKQRNSSQISRLLLTGAGGALNGIGDYLGNELQVYTTVPPSSFGAESTLIQEYAIPIGLALTSLKEDQKLNFRKEELTFSDPWKHLKTPLLAYLGTALLLSGSFYFFGQQRVERKLNQTKEAYSDLLRAMEIPYSSFENSDRLGGAQSFHNLSVEELEDRVGALALKLQKSPSPFELFPDVPRVSDFLAWLAVHPLVVDPISQKPLLHIKNLTYTMIKRPEGKKRGEKYKIRIELEFETETPKNAREFHDALIAPNDFIDPKGEVKWNSSGATFKTSFFLKNKAPRKEKNNV